MNKKVCDREVLRMG